jgi:cytochrome c
MGEADRGALVQLRDLTGQLRHELACQGAIPRHGVEESVLFEPSHLDDRIDQWARPSEDQVAVMLARDGPHAKVQMGGCAPVKLDFSLARGEPLFQSREVEVGVSHSALQFEGAITGQKDQGGMRRDELDLRALRGEKRLEKGDHVALVANQHDTIFYEVSMRDLRQHMGFAQDANKDRLWGAMPKQPVTVPLLAMALFMLAADLQNPGVERGYALIRASCSGCHAVGQADVSPMPDAPPLREVHQRYPVEHLAEALAEGLTTGHPGKPAFRFDAQQVDDIIEYLKSLER